MIHLLWIIISAQLLLMVLVINVSQYFWYFHLMNRKWIEKIGFIWRKNTTHICMCVCVYILYIYIIRNIKKIPKE